jgi:hypothetical protein
MPLREAVGRDLLTESPLIHQPSIRRSLLATGPSHLGPIKEVGTRGCNAPCAAVVEKVIQYTNNSMYDPLFCSEGHSQSPHRLL